MNEHGDGQDSVEEQLVGAAFDELAGRVTPPDRSAEILARVAGAAQEAPSDAGGGGARWLAAALLLLGVGVATQTAQLALTKGLARERAGKATSVGYLQIAFALVFGAAFFGQVPGPWSWAGMALVVGSVVFAQRR